MNAPRAAILSVGDELVLGTTLDTNSRTLSAALREAGLDVVEHRTVADDRELAAHFGALAVTRSDENFGDALVRFLTSWPVRLVLVIVLLGGFFVEIAAPGVGWFGAASTAALVLLVVDVRAGRVPADAFAAVSNSAAPTTPPPPPTP